ncbi:putative zinc protease [Thalassocella blandensis]|nr:putative zinc protease [Thalassocella blandensis]
MTKHTSTTGSWLNLLLLALCITFSASVTAAKLEKVRSIEGITEYQMNNGMQVLLFPDNSKDTITVNITYRVGSKHENYGETGMAHLLEHLLFKGTPKHRDIPAELTAHGAKANGTTWLERTNYYETFKASEENLRWALSLEADRMVNSFVAKEDLDSEMTVVRNEFEIGENSPQRILLQRVYQNAFDWHNYGNSTIGARSDIENVNIERLQAFYQKYYQPDNATLIVAGNIDEANTLKLIKKYFGKLKKPKRTLEHFYTKDPVQDGERSVVLRRVGSEQVVSAAYHIPSASHPDAPAINVLAQILGDSPSGRLHKNLVENKLATSTWAWPNFQQDASLLYFNVEADMKMDLNESQSALLDTVEDFEKHPITDEEVDRAKRKLLKHIELSFNSSQDISIELSEWIGIGDWRLLFIARDQLEEVTQEDVQRVAQHYLVRSNRTLGKFIPTSAPKRATISAAPATAELVDGYKGRKQIAQGELFNATPENIQSRLQLSKKKGIQIAALPIKTRGESVVVEMRLGYGNETSLFNKSVIAEMANSMFLRGIERLDREALQDEFDKLKASGGISGGGQSVYAKYETTRENLSDVITLIHEVLTTPTFPEKEFELLKSAALARLEADLSDPQALAFNTYSRHFNTHKPGHMFYTESIEEKIAAIKAIRVTDLTEFYRKHYGASNMQASIVGDFDADAISQQITTLFGDWKNATPYERVIRQYEKIESKEFNVETPDKKNSVFIAGLNLNLTKDDKDTPALSAVTHMLGGGFLHSRLATRIRQQDGLSYGVGAALRVSYLDSNGRFFGYAFSAPENTEKVHQAFVEELNRAIAEGFKAEELELAKESILNSIKVEYSDHAKLTDILIENLSDGVSMLDKKKLQDRLSQLKLEEVNAAMKKYLDPAQMTVVKAGDFAKVANTKK